MTSFEDLPLGPETVAALAAEGIETPTPFQAAAIPVIARGNDLLGRAGPGSGTLVGYGAPLLDRLEGGHGAPICLILCAGQRQATELARSFAGLCESSGARAAALAEPWLLPERADFLFVPADRVQALCDRSVDVAHVRALVLHDGDGVLKGVRADHLEAFLSGLPRECQRVFCGLPFGPALRSLAERFTHRAVTVPPGPRRPSGKPAGGAPTTDDAARELNVMVIEGDRSEAALALTATLLDDPVRHVLIFTSSADRAADLGDFLAMHGYGSGPPGDETVPVWLSPGEDADAREALDAIDKPATVATLSCSVPPGSAAATLRHGAGGPAWTLAAVRETGHLKEVAADAGLRLKRTRPARPPASRPPWTRASTSCTKRSAPPSWPPTTSSSSRSWTAFRPPRSPPPPCSSSTGRAVRSTRRRVPPPRSARPTPRPPRAGCDSSYRPAGATTSGRETCSARSPTSRAFPARGWGASTCAKVIPWSRCAKATRER